MNFNHNRLFQDLITTQHEHRLLALLLITLHLSLWTDLPSALTRGLLLLHLGFFVLWQPLWRWDDIQRRYTYWGLLAIVLLLLVGWHSQWLLWLWQLLLIGLLGGRDLSQIRDRVANLIALSFLAISLFIVTLPQLFLLEPYWFNDPQWREAYFILRYAVLVVPLGLLLINADKHDPYRQHIDFFHGLVLSLVFLVWGLGSLVLLHYQQLSYPMAIFQMSLLLALLILLFVGVAMVLQNHNHLDQIWTRHLYRIGGTFEQWLASLAQPENYKSLNPQEFLHTGLQRLLTLPWICGLQWHSLHGEGQLGTTSMHHVNVTTHALDVTVYSPQRINASQYFHVKLLIQLLEHFHQAKRREDAFAQQAHLQAIHETGAKLTHDIKNILQSLHAISSAIETCQPNQFGDTQRMLQGQMPHLTQRLKRTLDKLQKPAEFSYTNIPVGLWWSNLQARYTKLKVDFYNHIDAENVLVPEDLFDNVVENLLQNALMKRKREPDITIEVSLFIQQKQLELTVCDTGSAIPPNIARDLLTQPVPSRDGFGIGLYQAAKQIAHTGYTLQLSINEDGQVCFALSNDG